MSAVANKLTRRLAELDEERGHILIALKVLKEMEPETQTHVEKLAQRALAHVNGHHRPAANGSIQDKAIAFMQKQRGPVSTPTVTEVLGIGAERTWTTLNALTTATKSRAKLLKKTGKGRG